MKTLADRISWSPYRNFLSNQNSIKQFFELTRLSYGIAFQLVAAKPKGRRPKELRQATSEPQSYSVADHRVRVLLEYGWVTLAEYAKKESVPLREVKRLVSQGKLGKLGHDPKSGELMVIWPPPKQGTPEADALQPPLKRFKGVVSKKGSVTMELNLEDKKNFGKIQQILLYLLRSLGKPDEVAKKAQEMNNRACFLLDWINFESFLRDTVLELFRKHPAKLASRKLGKKTVTYEELVEFTNEFSTPQDLLASLIQREINEERSGDSVHALINLLKTEFSFEEDPYKAGYVFKGKQLQTSYPYLRELKEVRNALVHNDGNVSTSFFEEFPDVPHDSLRINIQLDYYDQANLALRSLVFHLADLIDGGKYSLRQMPKKSDTVPSSGSAPSMVKKIVEKVDGPVTPIKNPRGDQHMPSDPKNH